MRVFISRIPLPNMPSSSTSCSSISFRLKWDSIPLSANQPVETKLYPSDGINRTCLRRMSANSNGNMTSLKYVVSTVVLFAGMILRGPQTVSVPSTKQWLL